jgi:hypothetical protein
MLHHARTHCCESGASASTGTAFRREFDAAFGHPNQKNYGSRKASHRAPSDPCSLQQPSAPSSNVLQCLANAAAAPAAIFAAPVIYNAAHQEY